MVRHWWISPKAILDEVIEAGARRVCVVRAINTQASDPQDAAQQLSSRLRAALEG